MTYLVFKKYDNKLLKQFNDEQLAWDYAKEMKQNYMVRLVAIDTTGLGYKIVSQTDF